MFELEVQFLNFKFDFWTSSSIAELQVQNFELNLGSTFWQNFIIHKFECLGVGVLLKLPQLSQHMHKTSTATIGSFGSFLRFPIKIAARPSVFVCMLVCATRFQDGSDTTACTKAMSIQRAIVCNWIFDSHDSLYIYFRIEPRKFFRCMFHCSAIGFWPPKSIIFPAEAASSSSSDWSDRKTETFAAKNFSFWTNLDPE